MGTMMRSLYEMLGLLTTSQWLWVCRQALWSWQSTTLPHRLAILFASLSACFSQALRQLERGIRAQLTTGGHHD